MIFFLFEQIQTHTWPGERDQMVSHSVSKYNQKGFN